MPMIGEHGRESEGERHIPQSSPFRCGHLAVPVESLEVDLPFREIDGAPLERDHRTGAAAPVAGGNSCRIQGWILFALS